MIGMKTYKKGMGTDWIRVYVHGFLVSLTLALRNLLFQMYVE